MENEKILVIAAHPDDETLGVGGTIAKHIAEGDEVFVYILGEGVAGRHGEEVINEIKKQAVQAVEVLGVKAENVEFGGFLKDYRFDPTHLTELICKIEEKIEKTSPTIIYTHHAGDANSDHGIVYRATMAAVRPIARCNKNIKRVLCYETISSTEQSFQLPSTQFCPNVFVDISDYIEIKIKTLEFYKTEMQEWSHPRSFEGVRHLAGYRGCAVKKSAAEAFMLMREVI